MTMDVTSTHFKVPVAAGDRSRCLSPDGAAAHVTRVIRMIQGRWKLPIIYRLYAATAMRSSELLRDMPGISRKMLTQHLRELENDNLIERTDFKQNPPRVEYKLSAHGKGLMPVLIEARRFSERLPARLEP